MRITKFWRRWGLALGMAVLIPACSPGGPDLLVEGDALLRAGKADEAVAVLERAAQKIPTESRVFNCLGLAYHGTGRPEDARKAYRQALRINPDLVVSQFNLGVLECEQGNWRDAEAALRTYLQWNPNEPDAWARLGQAQFQSRQYDLAAKSLESALRLRRNDASSWNRLGMCQIQARQFREAYRSFSTAQQVQLGHPESLLNMAVTAQQYLQDRRTALQHYRTYAELKPPPPGIEGIRELVTQIERQLGYPLSYPAIAAATSGGSPATNAVPAPSLRTDPVPSLGASRTTVETQLPPVATAPVAGRGAATRTNPPAARTNGMVAIATPVTPSLVPSAPPTRPGAETSSVPAPATQPPPAPIPPTVASGLPTVPAPSLAAAPAPLTSAPSAPEVPVAANIARAMEPVIRSNSAAVSGLSAAANPVAAPVPTNAPVLIAKREEPPRIEPAPVVSNVPVPIPAPPAPEAATPGVEPFVPAPIASTRVQEWEAMDRPADRTFWRRMNPGKWFRREDKRIVTPLDVDRMSSPPRPVEPAVRSSPVLMASAAVPARAPLEKTAVSTPVVERPAPRTVPRYARRVRLPLRVGDHALAEEQFLAGYGAHQRRDYPAAIAAYQEAARWDPSHYDSHYNLAVLGMETGNDDLSLLAGEYAVAARPASVDARWNFALALLRARYPADAAEELERLASRPDASAREHLQLASIYAGVLSREEDARAHYRRALTIDPRHPQAEAVRAWLSEHPGR